MKKFWKNTTTKILTIAALFSGIGVVIGSYSSIENKAIEVVHIKEKNNKYNSYSINRIDSVFNCTEEILLLQKDAKSIKDTLRRLRFEAYKREGKVNNQISTIITMLDGVNTRIQDLIDRINNQHED